MAEYESSAKAGLSVFYFHTDGRYKCPTEIIH